MHLLMPLIYIAICLNLWADVTPAKKQSLPDAAMMALREQKLQDVKVSLKCNLGAKKTEVFGAIAFQKKKFVPIILKNEGKKFQIFALETSVRGPWGSDGNFLSDFPATGDNSLICEDPEKSRNLYPDAGHFMVPAELKAGFHLCFAASSVYNNWVCYTFDENAKKPVLSFVQMQAD